MVRMGGGLNASGEIRVHGHDLRNWVSVDL